MVTIKGGKRDARLAAQKKEVPKSPSKDEELTEDEILESLEED